MAPRKAPATAKPSKPKPAPKAASKPGLSKKVASAPKYSKKTPAPAPEPVPVWDRNITTQAQRERKRFKLSISYKEEEITEEYITNLAKNLVGESRNTWGIVEQEPITGVTAKKPRSRRVPSAFKDIEEQWMSIMKDMQDMQRVKKPLIPNSPDYSPILRIALEAREGIYSYLLSYPKPIMVKHDWTTLERNPFVDHSIIFVCKQFALEATTFLYKKNTFRAILRNLAYQFRRYEAALTLPTIYHANLRNLVLDCSRDCWNLDWHEKTAKGLTTLVNAKAVIDSLTLVMSPQRVGMSITALGVEAIPITFADFLWYHGPLMTAIRMLAPRVLKIIVKKPVKKRLGMEVVMLYLQAGLLEESLLANAETIRLREAKLKSVEDELMGLKERFEDIFLDDKRAVAEGRCTLLVDDELAEAASRRQDSAAVNGGEDVVEREQGSHEDPITISSRSSSEEPDHPAI